MSQKATLYLSLFIFRYRLGSLEFNRGVRQLQSLVPKWWHLPSPGTIKNQNMYNILLLSFTSFLAGQLLLCVCLCCRLHRPHLCSAIHLMCSDPLPPQRKLHRLTWLRCRLQMRLQWDGTFRSSLPDGVEPLRWLSLWTWPLPSPARRLPLRVWT